MFHDSVDETNQSGEEGKGGLMSYPTPFTAETNEPVMEQSTGI